MPNSPPEQRAILLTRLLGSHQWDRALRVAEECLAENPACNQAHRAAGWALVNLDKNSAALSHLRRALADNPRDAFLHRLASAAYAGLGFGDRAKKHLNEAIRLRPEDHYNWLQAAWKCYGARSYVACVKHTRQVLELAPDNVEAITLLALCERHDPKKQFALFQRALEIEPENFFVHYHIGVYHRRRGDYRHAIEAFRAALSGCPTNRGFQEELKLAQTELIEETLQKHPLYRLLRWPARLCSHPTTVVLGLLVTQGIFITLAQNNQTLLPYALGLIVGVPVLYWIIYSGCKSLLVRAISQRDGFARVRIGF